MKKGDEVKEEGKPDPLNQLVTTFCRGAMTERSGALQEDPLYMSYAEITAKYVSVALIIVVHLTSVLGIGKQHKKKFCRNQSPDYTVLSECNTSS